MVEEIAGLEEGQVREQVAEATEEELGKIRESQQQAQQIRQQIYAIQQTNQQHAWMLSLLLQYISNDVLLSGLFTQIHTYECAIPTVFSQVVPYLQDVADLSSYRELYPSIDPYLANYKTGLTDLVVYLKGIRVLYPELTNQPLVEYAQFVTAYAEQLYLIDRTDWDTNKLHDFQESLMGQL